MYNLFIKDVKSEGARSDMFLSKTIVEQKSWSLHDIKSCWIFFIVIASKTCYVCKKDRPCGQPFHLNHTDETWKENVESRKIVGAGLKFGASATVHFVESCLM